MSDPRDLVFSPAEVASSGIAYLHERRTNAAMGIPFGIPSVDRDFLPQLPGEVTTIIGRPGHGKSGVMLARARARCDWLIANGYTDRVVVYVTLEQAIEELNSVIMAASTDVSITDMARGSITDDEFSKIEKASYKRAALPLWFVGHSIEKRKKRPRLDIDSLYASLLAIDDWADEPIQIDMVFVDYLQRIQYNHREFESRRVAMDTIMNRLKDIALELACPFDVGVQARREVDSRSLPVPLIDDGQETSAIEQVSDKALSVTRPCRYVQQGEYFGEKSPVIVQGYSQLIIALLKQKMGNANTFYWVEYNPIYNRLNDAELRKVNLRNP